MSAQFVESTRGPVVKIEQRRAVRARRMAALTIALAFVASGCWFQSGWDAGHSNDNITENTVTPANASQLQAKWIAAGGDPFAGSPAVGNNAVYVAESRSGAALPPIGPPAMSAWNEADGTALWLRPFDLAPTSPVVGNSVYGGSGLIFTTVLGPRVAELVALSAATGAPVWTSPLPGATPTSATLASVPPPSGGSAEGTLFVALTDTHVVVAYTLGGVLLSESPAANYATPVAVGNGFAYVGNSNGTLTALNASDLAQPPEWSGPVSPTAATIVGSPAVSGTSVFAVAADGSVAGINAVTGTPLWADTTLGGTASDSPAAGNGVVYVTENTATSDNLVALDATSGSTLWTHVPTSPPYLPSTGPIVVGSVLYYDDGQFIDVLNVAGGTKVAYLIGRSGEIAASDGMVFVPGSPVWAYGL
jgi:outer membrane protein assembly factor BamB